MAGALPGKAGRGLGGLVARLRRLRSRIHGLVLGEHLLGAISAAQARLREQAERAQEQARERSTLLAVSRSVASTLEMEPLMGTILDELRRVVAYSAVSVRLLYGTELVMLAYRGADVVGHWARARAPLSESPAVEEVVRRRAPLIIGDFQTDEPALLDGFRRSRAAMLASLRAQLRAWMGVPLIVRDQVIGAIVLSHAQPGYYTAHHAEMAQAFANHAAVAVDNARLYEQAQQAAALEERQRLARELHDAVTQTLFSASLIAEVLPRLWQRDPAEGRRRLEELRQLTRGALAEMRTLLLELRPAVLTETPLRDLLRQLSEAVNGRARIPVTLHVEEVGRGGASPAREAAGLPGEGPALPPDVQLALYRIAQEALHNAAKHAGAERCEVRLRQEPRRVELRIEDDGRGFDPQAVSADHLGLRIMRERAEAAGATLRVESCHGRGTTVAVVWNGPGGRHGTNGADRAAGTGCGEGGRDDGQRDGGDQHGG